MSMSTLFHLAFPCHDLEAAKLFYQKLGCEFGRESKHAIIINLGHHQLVAHRVDAALPEPKEIYPRHFGLIFLDKTKYDALVARIMEANMVFYIEPRIRFADSRLEHHSFFLKDPSNNLLEFKYYVYEKAIFGEHHYQQIGDT